MPSTGWCSTPMARGRPYEQTTDVPWARIAAVLRHAAHAYDYPAYEQLIRHVPTTRWRSLRMNLLYPPLALARSPLNASP